MHHGRSQALATVHAELRAGRVRDLARRAGCDGRLRGRDGRRGRSGLLRGLALRRLRHTLLGRLHGLRLLRSEGAGQPESGAEERARDAPGELVVLPLHPGMELDVREHAFLVASHSIQYSFVRIKGLVNLLHGGNGMYVDRFITTGYPGMLLLHGNGNVLERTLKPGEKILVEPGGFLYKDSTVQMQAAQMPLRTGLMRHGMYLAEMTGPGRVGIQSMYVHHHAD